MQLDVIRITCVATSSYFINLVLYETTSMSSVEMPVIGTAQRRDASGTNHTNVSL